MTAKQQAGARRKSPAPAADLAKRVVWLDPTTLTPHPRNYNDHPPEQIAHIQASIREHGFYRYVLLARGDVILAGHGVTKASIEMGEPRVPCLRFDLDPDDPRALKILAGDNEIARGAQRDDRALAALIASIADLGGGETALVGTGYDATMLAALVDRVSEPIAPDAFQRVDMNVVTHFKCPSCKYEWSGKPGGKSDSSAS